LHFDECEISVDEIIASAQQGLAQSFRERIREAVTVIQTGAVPAFPESGECRSRDLSLR
jgi:hypothetical protein